MYMLRRIITDDQLEIKIDPEVVKALREMDPDDTKAPDVIRRHKMTLYQFTYLMVALIGRNEAIMRFQIVQSFTVAIFDNENEKEDIEETAGIEDSGVNMQYGVEGGTDSLINASIND